MKMIKFKMWLASISKRTWAYVAAISAFVILAIAGLFVWMHMCGYTLASWLGRFWPTLVVVSVAATAVILGLVFFKIRKGRRNGK